MGVYVFTTVGRGVLPVRFTPLRNCASTICQQTRTHVFNNVRACCSPFMHVRRKRVQQGSTHSVRPSGGPSLRLVPRLVTPSTSGLRRVVSLFVRGKCRRTSVGLNYPFPVLTQHRGNYNVLPCPRRIGTLLSRTVSQRPSVHFSIGLHLN